MNGALFYGQHLAKNTTYKKFICLGISGDEKHHRITPIFVDERGNYKVLSDVESFISFNEDNIEEYYIKELFSFNLLYKSRIFFLVIPVCMLYNILNYNRKEDIT